MKIFDFEGRELYDLPDKPRNFDGWANERAYGLEVGDERITLGTATSFEQADYRLTQLRRAYIDGAKIFVTEAAS